MAYIGVVLIAAANCALLYFVSVLALDAASTVRLAGFAWIGLLAIVSIALCARGKGGAALLTAAATLPAGYIALLVALMVGAAYESRRPNSAAFVALCKTAGTKFIATPSAPVRSIAYDWEGAHPPQFNYFALGSNGNVQELRGGLGTSPYPPEILFTESRCCRFEGGPANGVGPFIRRPNPGTDYFGVKELTADAVVTFRAAVIPEPQLESELVQYDVSVTDRRDGRTLASLRYFFNAKQRRACGSVAEGVMDERAFVLKAITVK